MLQPDSVEKCAEEQEPAPVSRKKNEGKKKCADGMYMCMFILVNLFEKWPIT